MMAVYCDDLNKRVLLATDSVEAIQGSGGCILVRYQCACGRRGELLTGRRQATSSRHLID